jgi:hypothetical protein
MVIEVDFQLISSTQNSWAGAAIATPPWLGQTSEQVSFEQLLWVVMMKETICETRGVLVVTNTL